MGKVQVTFLQVTGLPNDVSALLVRLGLTFSETGSAMKVIADKSEKSERNQSLTIFLGSLPSDFEWKSGFAKFRDQLLADGFNEGLITQVANILFHRGITATDVVNMAIDQHWGAGSELHWLSNRTKPRQFGAKSMKLLAKWLELELSALS